MKKRIAILIAATSIFAAGFGFSTMAEEKNVKTNLDYVKDLNEVRENTKKVNLYGAECVVGYVVGKGYKIKRELIEDKSGKVMHMADTVMDTEKGPVQVSDEWYDLNKNVEYYYDYGMKKYMIDSDNDGWYEKERLNIDSYYLEQDDRNKESLVGEVKIDENISINVYEDEYSELEDVTLDVKGEKISCRVIQYYEEYECPAMYYINNRFKALGDDLTYENDKDTWYNKQTSVYYIGKNDNRLYKIESRLIRNDNPEVSTGIEFFYPKSEITIPKKFRVKPLLADGCKITKGDIEYESVIKNNKAVLKTFDVASKKVLKKKTLTIPRYVRYYGRRYKVTGIGRESFLEMSKLKKLKILADIKKIEFGAFGNCGKLRKVYIKTKKLKKISKYAFYVGGSKKITFYVPSSKKKLYKKLLRKSLLEKFVVK